jgi:hypothetical protein
MHLDWTFEPETFLYCDIRSQSELSHFFSSSRISSFLKTTVSSAFFFSQGSKINMSYWLMCDTTQLNILCCVWPKPAGTPSSPRRHTIPPLSYPENQDATLEPMLWNMCYYSLLQWVSRIKIVVCKLIIFSQFWPLLKRSSIFEAAGAVAIIESSIKSNQHCQI